MEEHAPAETSSAPAQARPDLVPAVSALAAPALARAGPAAIAQAVAQSPGAALALQRAAGNRAVSRLIAGRAARRTLQRAILVVHGAADSEEERKATEACLSVLSTRKTGGHARSVEAPRGAAWTLDFKGAARDKPPAGPPAGFLAGDHALYILGHGGGLRPRTLGGFTAERVARMLTFYFADEDFTGKIKLVSCMSAADRIHLGPGKSVSISPFAGDLAEMLEPDEDDDLPFRPASVQGIVGIAWVDASGRMISIDPAAYARELAKNEAAVDAAFAELDPVAREKAIQALFPGEEIQVGKRIKRRARINYPQPS